jgi:ribosomal protein L11 methyltransferase
VTIRARILAAEVEAERIARLIERAVEDEGLPVTRHETVDGGPWAVEVLFFEEDAASAEARVRDALGGDAFGAPIEVEPLPELDWMAKSLEGLAPVRVGRFLVHGRHDRAARATAVVPIEIDAGLAFGTGHHETTVGCLRAIERRLKLGRARRPLDLGTGTGVLAIAAARVWHVPVLATDVDPVAVAVARENARLNGVAPLVAAIVADGMAHARLRGGRFDFIAANILAKPLARLAPAIARSLARGGTLVLSGLRRDDGARIVSAYRAQGLRLVRRDPDGHWLTLTFMR